MSFLSDIYLPSDEESTEDPDFDVESESINTESERSEEDDVPDTDDDNFIEYDTDEVYEDTPIPSSGEDLAEHIECQCAVCIYKRLQ